MNVEEVIEAAAVPMSEVPIDSRRRQYHQRQLVASAEGAQVVLPPQGSPVCIEHHRRLVSQREKLSYCGGGHLLVVLFGLVSGLLLVIGLARFALTESLVWVALPFVVMNGLYLILSYALMLSGNRFRLVEHQQLLQRWWPADRGRNVSVDVFLPVCGERRETVLQTWAGVREMKWAGPLQVYVLDDSTTDCFRADAERFGFHYLRRGSRSLRKAGNLRYGFSRSSGDFILLLDADFRPRPDILQELMPYLLESDRLAVVQSPQYFDVHQTMGWIEAGAGYVQELFYRLIQPARDAWGAGVCVGSCAVYRRAALEPLEGCAGIDHSEDLWTGFELLHQGWQLKYVPLILAKGLCPEHLEPFYSQQYRWCRGSLSLVASGRFWRSKLNVSQKLCYIAGFIYYLATALNSVLTPLPPLMMVALFPGWVHWHHLAFSILALIYTPCIIGLWSTYPFGLHFLTTREVSGAAHLQAVVDSVRGSMQDWVVSGSGHRARLGASLPWALVSVLATSAVAAGGIWVFALSILSEAPSRWFHFLPPMFFSGMHAAVCWRIPGFSWKPVTSRTTACALFHRVCRSRILSGTRWKRGDWSQRASKRFLNRPWLAAASLACLGVLPSLAVLLGGIWSSGKTTAVAALAPGSIDRLLAEERYRLPFALSTHAAFSPYTVSEAFPGLDLTGSMRLREHPAQAGTYYVADYRGLVREVRFNWGKWTSRDVVDLRHTDLDWLYSFDIHPRFPEDPRLFLCYRTGGKTQPMCFHVAAVTLPQGGMGSSQQVEILIEQQVDSEEHLAGDLAFDASGFLLISCGDNARAGKDRHSQRIDGGFFSGILRIDVDQRGGRVSHPPTKQPEKGKTRGYYIPDDNPFCGEPNALEEFWSLGLRNPFRISCDAATDQVWVGDVGQDRLEQVEVATSGSNHLWSFQEGTAAYTNSIHQGHLPHPLLGRPVNSLFEYAHEDLNLCVIGGVVYRGSMFSELQGRYLFGDNRSGRIWSLDPARPDQCEQILQLPFGKLASSLVSISTDRAGNIFLTNFTSSPGIYRIDRSEPARFPELLSETGLLTASGRFELRDDFIPYEVAVSLWSDGMLKRRWIALPPGARIDNVSSSDRWRFPPGTVFVKHFEYPKSQQARIPVETRILVVRDDGTTIGASYLWDDTGGEARLQRARRELSLPGDITDSPLYRVPGPADCLICHHRENPVLGFEALQLNVNISEPSSQHSQLASLSERGLFVREISLNEAAQGPRLFRFDQQDATLEQRCRSYLHANCSFCHNPHGPEHVGLDLRYDASERVKDFVGASAQLRYHRIDGHRASQLIAPGQPEASAIWLRLQTTDPAMAMPYLGRTRVDTTAVEALREWIHSLPRHQSATPAPALKQN